MDEMNCAECRSWLNAYVDNELAAGDAARVARHVAGCAGCAAELRGLQTLTMGLRETAPHFDLPPGLADRVFAALPQPATDRRPAPRRRRWLWTWLAPAGSLAALAAALMLYLSTPAMMPLADEAVSAHVRSLMVSHLSDVASSDHHTVKPWFAGKLDFSPPVADFAPQGFALVGGRLDYLRHRAAAAMGYRHGQHVINLFVQPETGGDRDPAESRLQGYNVLSWRQGQMRYVAVSDMDMAEMHHFADLWRRTE